MFQRSTMQWHMFRSSPPGLRFQRIHERRCTARGIEGDVRRGRLLLAGMVTVASGLALMAVSSAGAFLLLAGLLLMGRESAALAAWLDHMDVKRVQMKRDLLYRWHRHSREWRRMVGLGATLLLAAGLVILVRG